MAADRPPRNIQHLPPVRIVGNVPWPLPAVRIVAASGVTPPLFRSQDAVAEGANT
jgi:hypothetical protein